MPEGHFFAATLTEDIHSLQSGGGLSDYNRQQLGTPYGTYGF